MTPWPLIFDALLPDAAGPPAAPLLRAKAAAEPATPAFIAPFVHDDGQAVSLHFTPGELQSRMCLSSPHRLEVDYTRTMMGFVLLTPMRQGHGVCRIGMVGLGGGSLAKFCYHQLSNTHITVLEINPHVIALRRAFCVPDDDARFEVIAADGAAYLAAQTARFDVLLVDGFDHQGQPPALCTLDFYDDCFAALAPGGVLVVNLHYDDADFPLLAERVRRSFAGNAVEVPAPEKSNCIVFAARGAPISPRHIHVNTRLARLGNPAKAQLKAEFARIVWHMKDLSEPGSPDAPA